MSSAIVARSSSAAPAPSTSAPHTPPKRALSESENDAEPEPQLKRARSLAPNASTASVGDRDKKKKPKKKKKKKKAPVTNTSTSPNGSAREHAPEMPANVVAKPRSASTVASGSKARSEPEPESVPALSSRQPTPSTSKTLFGSDVAAVKDAQIPEPPPVDDLPQPPVAEPQPALATSALLNKGKNKAPELEPPELQPRAPMDAAPTSSPSAPPALDPNAELLAKHTSLLASIAQSLTCQICLNGLHKPYALAPCGHVACRDCLVSWFSAPAPDAQGPDRRPVALRPKKCPHCRAVVEARPAEVWVLKEIAGAMARSGLAPEPIAAPPEPAHAEAQDPWEGIFPAPGGPRDARGVRDDEDGVWRCVDCFHEIWDGVCSGCERVYPDHEDEDEDAEADALLAALGERLDDEDGGWGQAPGAWPAAGAPRAGYRPWWARGMPNNGLLEPSDDEDDDDFIDDGPAYPAHWRVDNWPPLGYDPPDDDDEEDEDIDVEALPVPRRRVIDVDDEEEGYESDFIDDDDDDENGHHEVVDVDAVNAAAPDVVELDSDSDDEVLRPVRRVRALIPDNDDDDDEVQILDPPARRGGRPYPIVVDSDEEGYADGEDLYVADAAEDPYVAPAQQDPYADEEDLYSAGTDSDEDEGSDDETDQLQYPESGDEQVEDDGSINRIPMRIARELGRGARI